MPNSGDGDEEGGDSGGRRLLIIQLDNVDKATVVVAVGGVNGEGTLPPRLPDCRASARGRVDDVVVTWLEV